MAKKTNKTHKLRGSREHGRGMKKGRGAGLRGGKGQAGWKHKKLHFLLYDQDRIRGARNIGFTRHAQDTEPDATITVQHLDEGVAAWSQEGKATLSGNQFTVDLGPLGYDKLLGTGQVTRQLAVTVGRASPSAVSKIQAAGGSVTQTNPPPPPKPKGGAPAPPAGGKPPKAEGGAKPPKAEGGGKPPKTEAAKGGAPKEGKGGAPPAGKPPKQQD